MSVWVLLWLASWVAANGYVCQCQTGRARRGEPEWNGWTKPFGVACFWSYLLGPIIMVILGAFGR